MYSNCITIALNGCVIGFCGFMPVPLEFFFIAFDSFICSFCFVCFKCAIVRANVFFFISPCKTFFFSLSCNFSLEICCTSHAVHDFPVSISGTTNINAGLINAYHEPHNANNNFATLDSQWPILFFFFNLTASQISAILKQSTSQR